MHLVRVGHLSLRFTCHPSLYIRMSKRALSGSPVPSASAPSSPKRPKFSVPPPAVPAAVGVPTAHKTKKRKRPPPPEFGSREDVLQKEVKRLLESEGRVLGSDEGWDAPEGAGMGVELEVRVRELSSTGDGLALVPEGFPPWVVVTPFALPNEKILVKLLRPAHGHSEAKLLEVLEPNPELRDMSLVKCKYFGKCAGCQYQMLAYDTQLDVKRDVVVRAYKYFSKLPESSVPTVLPTIASPLQYGYRTKITPHFDAPPWQRQGRRGKDRPPRAPRENSDWEVRIGFDEKGEGRRVLDIEECPIATGVINEGLKEERKKIQETIENYTRGATMLIRDSILYEPANPFKDAATEVRDDYTVDSSAVGPSAIVGRIGRTVGAPAVENEGTVSNADAGGKASIADGVDAAPPSSKPDGPATCTDDGKERHICVTSTAATIYDRVGPYLFSFPASAFFQNNSSVLVPLTDHVKTAIESATVGQGQAHPTHLVDAYCGSGLFSLMLSSSFEKISGIDISVHSISSAVRNLALNDLPSDKFAFQTGTASDIFASVSHFPSSQTAAVIDPPRKGCDEPFLRQLLNFRPKVIVYVSCNVHTQARDLGWLLRTQEEEGRTPENGAYGIVSLRGFDLFPQTGHVESVAVLVR
ncbi:S-adenosyl-L-methionine-dependent methyltransferase [Dacryopinax primogenitus]|uniref:S-adenosyl-L-methionine-dependent methyltransferase n=1 Tax=Dacryopinax primogenitus (strain DJM 731) TaxID=1858805 RepID=M5G5P5_DACPD|nr:S-adenosyl-L-methionine-dependent methyltransferase [Dacryopinax primogenitus]EJT99082.1 S-adenosyl-L-methionine-dependent methyltransferase [Dacryopinax primogenitus]